MIDCKTLQLTIDQIDDMRHAVGLEPRKLRKNQWKCTVYRNYFTTCRPETSWEDLCKKGLAEMASYPEERCVVYRVTPDGLKALQYIFGVTLEVK